MGTTRRRGARTVIWAVRLLLAGTVIAPAVEMPNLSGDWLLNKDQSDDPEEVMKDERSSGGGCSGGGMGRGGRGRRPVGLALSAARRHGPRAVAAADRGRAARHPRSGPARRGAR